MSRRFTSVFTAFILTLFVLFLLWPSIIKFSYLNSSISTPISMTSLGQLGDSFSPLTAFFTLIALIFSIYTNYIQYRQLKDNKDDLNLSIYRELRRNMFEDKDIIEGIYMMEYDRFKYDGSVSPQGLRQEFYDNKNERAHAFDVHGEIKEELSRETEKRIDRLLSYYEELVTLSESGLVRGVIYNHMFLRVDRTLNNKYVEKYLENLHMYFQEGHPYPFLWKRLLGMQRST